MGSCSGWENYGRKVGHRNKLGGSADQYPGMSTKASTLVKNFVFVMSFGDKNPYDIRICRYLLLRRGSAVIELRFPMGYGLIGTSCQSTSLEVDRRGEKEGSQRIFG